VIDCAKKTIQWEGVMGLYKGVAAPLAGQMFFRATLFSALGSSKRWLSTEADGTRRPLTTLDCYKAGAMAGGAAAFFEGPIDFYKSQVRGIAPLLVFPDHVQTLSRVDSTTP
jgi:solute carrier family 25 (mitochondrial carnitine/acylcarnitine transporter), member 20/29